MEMKQKARSDTALKRDGGNMASIYPQHRLLRADAVSVVVTWSLLGLAGVLGLLRLAGLDQLETAAKVSVIGFFVATLVHIVLALLHKCPDCEKHPTIQGLTPLHPASLKQSRASGWAGVVVCVLRKKRFVCIHCGTEHEV